MDSAQANLKKLNKIIAFINNNRDFNRSTQFFYYRKLSCYQTAIKKLRALLYSTVHTQSKPKIDSLGNFWKLFHNRSSGFTRNKIRLEYFVSHILDGEFDKEAPWLSVFKALKSCDGWGDKTAALFVKNAINIHSSKEDGLKFFEVHDPIILDTDAIYLPVDGVIKFIFEKYLGVKSPSFNSINEIVINNFGNKTNEITILLDDLWFWGFVTQKNGGQGRVLEWNENKFFNLEGAPFEDTKVIEEKSKEFIRILKS